MSSSTNTNRPPPPPPRRSALRPHQVSIMAPMYAPLAGSSSSSGSGSDSDSGDVTPDEDDEEEDEDNDEDEASMPRPTISPLTPTHRRSPSPSPSPGASDSPAPSPDASPAPSTSDASSEVIDPDIPLPSIEGPRLDCETRLRRARREARCCLHRVRRDLQASEADAAFVRGLLADERRRVKEVTRRLRDCEEHGRAMQAQIDRLSPVRRQQPARQVKRPVDYRPGRG